MESLNNPIKINLVPTTKWKWARNFGLTMYSIVICAFIAFFAYITYLAFSDSIIFGVFVSGIMVFLVFCCKRFIELNIFFEQIIVDSKHFTILIKSPVNTKKTIIPLDEIEYFGTITSDFYNDSHMPFVDNFVYDTTGIEVYHERENLVEDGRMEIRTNKKKIRFGKGMTSWDTDSIVRSVELHTGLYFKR